MENNWPDDLAHLQKLSPQKVKHHKSSEVPFPTMDEHLELKKKVLDLEKTVDMLYTLVNTKIRKVAKDIRGMRDHNQNQGMSSNGNTGRS